MRKIIQNEENTQNDLLNIYSKNFGIKCRKMETSQQIRIKLFEEIIKLINKKKCYMLGPEKSITARFFAENYKEIYEILDKILWDLILNQKQDGV